MPFCTHCWFCAVLGCESPGNAPPGCFHFGVQTRSICKKSYSRQSGWRKVGLMVKYLQAKFLATSQPVFAYNTSEGVVCWTRDQEWSKRVPLYSLPFRCREECVLGSKQVITLLFRHVVWPNIQMRSAFIQKFELFPSWLRGRNVNTQ